MRLRLMFRKNKKNQPEEIKKPAVKVKAGIAFGGGGTRGFAHIGAIKAFEECGIEFSYITGTSVGSLVGSLYACGIKSYEMLEFAKDLKVKDIRNSRIIFISSNSYNIEKVLSQVIGDKTFEELSKPLCVIAVDLKSGEEIILKSGNIAKAVSASCAVPGIFTPVVIDSYHLVDGGVINPIPSDTLRMMGAEKVVAIDLNSARGNGTDSLKMLDVLSASFRIAMTSTAIKGVINSDILINPDLSKYKATSIKGMDEMVQIGYDATMAVMDEIMEMLKISPKAGKVQNRPEENEQTETNEEPGEYIKADENPESKIKEKKIKVQKDKKKNKQEDENKSKSELYEAVG